MTFLAIVAALALEQWRTLRLRGQLERAFVRYARYLERTLNGGTREHGVLAAGIALVPPVVVTAALYFALDSLHPLLAVVLNVAVLYLVMGFRRFSHAVSAIVAALQANDLTAARRALAAWRGGLTAELSSGEVAKLAVERGLVDAYRQVFGVLFWFVVLPGPAGAILYRAAALLANEWKAPTGAIESTPIGRERAAFGAPVRFLLELLDWLPVRITALSFAIVGDFEDAVDCWRTQAGRWAKEEGGTTVGILLSSGGGALGVQLGGPLPVAGGEREFRPEMGMGQSAEPEILPSAVGLVWRALLLWIGLVLLATLAHFAP
jgi:adenosylcobinamide-phosphate synthase